MNGNLKRHNTVYIKDVLPAQFTTELLNAQQRKEETKRLVSEQIILVKECEQNFAKIKEKFIKSVRTSFTDNDLVALSTVSVCFLQSVLNNILKEETKIRNELSGQQECVEMFKGAVSEQGLSSSHLESARSKRNDLTTNLSIIIENREVLALTIEVLKHTGTTLPSSSVVNDCLLSELKLEYEASENVLQHEQDKLKMFTDWPNNPEAMRRDINS